MEELCERMNIQLAVIKMRIDYSYYLEKVEAYNVAIEGLRMHEPASDGDSALAAKLREQLARKLDREIQRWCNQVQAQMRDIFVAANEARLAGEPREFWEDDLRKTVKFLSRDNHITARAFDRPHLPHPGRRGTAEAGARAEEERQ